jgi:phage terminase large subunit-like protein
MKVSMLKRSTHREQYRWMKNMMEWKANLKEEQNKEAERRAGVEVNHKRSHYWFVEKKSKRGKKWIVVRDLQMTKREAAEYFCKHLRLRTDYKFRLRHIMKYSG